MSQADFGIVLMIFLVTLGFTLFIWLVPYRREMRRVCHGRVLAVKGELAWLMESGMLSKDNEAFRILHQALEQATPIASATNLQQIVATVTNVGLFDSRRLELFRKECRHPEPLRQVTREFFSVVADILMCHSFFVRIALRVNSYGLSPGFLYRARVALSTVFRTENKALDLYREAMTSKLKLAA